MIQPVNNHLLIEPVKSDSFISSDKGTYEEIGIVISKRPWYKFWFPKEKDKVFFDSYLAAKYPKNDKEYYWLVKWEDVRAIEKNEKIPE